MTRRPSPDQLRDIITALGQLVTALPVRYRAAAAAGLAFVIALMGSIYVDQTQPVPQLATAMGPGGLDANLLLWGDRVDVQPARYDADGHARPPSWQSETPVIGGRVPFSPVMNWGFAGAAAVAQKREPLRYCLSELADGPGEVVGVARLVLDEFQQTFDLLPFEENCTNPHLVLGATAGVDCGIGDQAWGCAWLRGSHIRVTYNGTVYRSGAMGRQQLIETFEHEIGHTFDRGHTECGHPHATDMAPVGCGNGPGIAVEDYDDGHLGLTLRRQEPPPPPPPPPVPQAHVVMQRWTSTGRPGSDWAVEDLAAEDRPVDQDAWYVTVVVTPDGAWHYTEFLSVPAAAALTPSERRELEDR